MENRPENIGSEDGPLFCSKCGNRLSPAVTFCETCGSPVRRSAQPVSVPAAQPLPPGQPAEAWQPPAPPWQRPTQWQARQRRQPVYAAAETHGGTPRWLIAALGALAGSVLAGMFAWLYIALI